MTKQIALKIDVDTYRGTRDGVPRLVEALKRHGAQATFFFSMGPDHTGRAIKRVFRPGFMKKVSRTSVVEHYGIRTLLYGTLLPGPNIGWKCRETMLGVRDAGFECGIHCYDHILWQDHVAGEDAAWTQRELKRAVNAFFGIFGEMPKAHAAAGWQINRHALRLLQQMGFDYSSDTRGTHPFLPTWNAEIIACPQLPTTLPTLDELIGRDDITRDNVDQHLLELTAGAVPDTGHVYTLHAELEGGKFLPTFEKLLAGWKEQGYELVSMRQYFESLPGTLPCHEVVMGEIEGRSGTLALQGE